jgi:PDGLE domain
VKRISSMRWFVIAGLLVAIALVVLVSPLADSDPDGLNRVAEDQGFASSEADHDLKDGPLADYAVRGVDDERMSKGLAGVIGLLATFALCFGVFAVVRRRKISRAEGVPD